MDMISELEELIDLCVEKKEELHLFLVKSTRKGEEKNWDGQLKNEIYDIEYAFMHLANNYSYYCAYSPFLMKFNCTNTKKYINLFCSSEDSNKEINSMEWMLPTNTLSTDNLYSLTYTKHLMPLMCDKVQLYEYVSKIIETPTTYIYDSIELDEMDFSVSEKWVIKQTINKEQSTMEVFGKNEAEILKEKVFNLFHELNQKITVNNPKIIIQEFIDGLDVEVSVIKKGSKYIILPAVEIGKAYKYKEYLKYKRIAKLQKSGCKLFQPSKAIENKIISNTEKCLKELGEIEGICKFIYKVRNENVYFIDFEIPPSLSEKSSTYFVFNNFFPKNEFSLYQCLIGSKLYSIVNKEKDLKKNEIDK